MIIFEEPQLVNYNDNLKAYEFNPSDIVNVRSFRNFINNLKTCVENNFHFNIVHNGSIKMTLFENFIKQQLSDHKICFLVDNTTFGKPTEA